MARMKLDLAISGTKYSYILFISESLSQTTFSMGWEPGYWQLHAPILIVLQRKTKELQLEKRKKKKKKASEKHSEGSMLTLDMSLSKDASFRVEEEQFFPTHGGIQ